MIKRLEANIYGRVQGVSFRYYTRLAAQRLQVAGWVVNQRDGSVRTVAEGPELALQAFLQFLHEGSPSARVEHVTVSWQAATGEFNQFKVRWF